LPIADRDVGEFEAEVVAESGGCGLLGRRAFG
jgi:hypothetical protein